MSSLQWWLSRVPAVAVLGLALILCGGASRLLSEFEAGALFGRQSGPNWCQRCAECTGTNTQCSEDNDFCNDKDVNTLCHGPYYEHYFFLPEDCSHSWGNEYCIPGSTQWCKCIYWVRCWCQVPWGGGAPECEQDDDTAKWGKALLQKYYALTCECDPDVSGPYWEYSCTVQ